MIFRANSIHFERAIKSLANKSSSKRRLGKVKKEWTTIGEQERKIERGHRVRRDKERERERERELNRKAKEMKHCCCSQSELAARQTIIYFVSSKKKYLKRFLAGMLNQDPSFQMNSMGN